MNQEVGSDPFVRPQFGQIPARRPAATDSAALNSGHRTGTPVELDATPPPAQSAAASDAPSTGRTWRPSGSDEVGAWRHDTPSDAEFSFGDLVDVINPLQHIPGISALYREITGDEISGPARVLGGMLYGGPVGLVGALANTIAEEATGRDLGAAMMATILGEDDTAAADSIAAEAGESPDEAGLAAEATPALNGEGEPGAATPSKQAAPATTAGGPPNGPAEAPQATDAGKSQPLTGEAALKALAADLGAGTPGPAETETAPAAGQDAPAGIPMPRQLSAAQGPGRSIPLRPRDWRSAGVARQPKPLPLGAPGPAVPTPKASLTAGQNQALQAVSSPSGQYPSPVSPALLASGPDGSGFAGRMLEALDKYSAMMGQDRAAGRTVTAE